MFSTFLWIFFFTASTISSSCQKDKINLSATIKKHIDSRQEDLVIKLTLCNQTKKPLLIHKHSAFGYLSMCFEDDYCFEAQKKDGNQFRKMEHQANIDRIPGYDSSGVAWNDMYDTLDVERDVSQSFNVNGYYSFDQGQYRIRFAFQIPAKNNLPVKTIHSNWVYFEVKAKHIDFEL